MGFFSSVKGKYCYEVMDKRRGFSYVYVIKFNFFDVCCYKD